MNGAGPTTKEELRQSLDRTILQAYENGVNLENGAYQLRHDGSNIPDWELMVFLLKS
jgi:hypothetical protein